jgi:hypothetical protein
MSYNSQTLRTITDWLFARNTLVDWGEQSQTMKNDFQQTIDNFFFATIAKNKAHIDFEGTEAERFLFNRAFYLGAQWSAKTSSELSPHIAKFIEFMVWLTADEIPQDAA